MGKTRDKKPYAEFIPSVKVGANSLILYNTLIRWKDSTNHLKIGQNFISAKTIGNSQKEIWDMLANESIKNTSLSPYSFPLAIASFPNDKKAPISKGNGFISNRSASRLKNYIQILFWKSGCYTLRKGKFVENTQGKITFLTLTLASPQVHSDQEIKARLLNQFLIELNTQFPDLLYLWRCEKQQNKDIHFHILLNKFIPWQDIRSKWNKIQNKLGYVDVYTEKFSKMTFEDFRYYSELHKIKYKNSVETVYNEGTKCGWTNPNSTDIQKLHDIKHVGSYITKYMCKETKLHQNLIAYDYESYKIGGKQWYCCAEIMRDSPKGDTIVSKIVPEIKRLCKMKSIRVFVRDYITVYCITPSELYNKGFTFLYNLFIDAVFNNPYKRDLCLEI